MSIVYPRAKLQLDVPKYGNVKDTVVWHPLVQDCNWTRNNHLLADELTVTLSHQTSGVDPRLIKNARASLWLWDEGVAPFSEEDHLRFVGIATKASRRLSDSGLVVDMTFQDYTNFFIHMKPFPSAGMPTWDMTLPQIWAKICDNTGYYDPDDNKKIISSVEVLRDHLIMPDEFLDRTSSQFLNEPLGSRVPARFKALQKPHPPGTPSNVSAWDVWQWCVGSLGLISYIEGDRCVVTDTTEHYKKANAPRLIWGDNIESIEETADCGVSQKGVLFKSYNGLTGGILEAVYPKPGDERLKVKRAVAKRALKEGREANLNELSADFIEFERHGITDQAVLDRIAKSAYEQMVRQEVEGKITTKETTLVNQSGEIFNIFDLHAGDAIAIGVDKFSQDVLKSKPDEAARVQFLMDSCGYSESVARIIAKNADDDTIWNRAFHIKTLNVKLSPETFSVELDYHNLILVDE